MNLSIQHKVVLFFNNSSPKNKITKDMYAPKFMWSCLHNEKFYNSRLWWLLCPHHLHRCSIMSCHYKQNVRAPTIFAFFALLFWLMKIAGAGIIQNSSKIFELGKGQKHVHVSSLTDDLFLARVICTGEEGVIHQVDNS